MRLTKLFNRVIAGELALRHAGEISSVAFDPAYVIDKSDPALAERWPSGFYGFLWRMITLVSARHPAIAGEPIAELILSDLDRSSSVPVTLQDFTHETTKIVYLLFIRKYKILIIIHLNL